MNSATPHVKQLFRAGKLRKINIQSKNAAVWDQYVYTDPYSWKKSLFIRVYNPVGITELKALIGAEMKIPKTLRKYVVMPIETLSTKMVRVYPLYESDLLVFLKKRQMALRMVPPGHLQMQMLIHEREMIEISSQLESIMRGLHQQGIVHNDWKLENVLISPGPSRHVIVADLECATFHTNAIPECFSLVTLDPRFPTYKNTDNMPYIRQEQFALAHLIYRLLTFDVLFETNWDGKGNVYDWLERTSAWKQASSKYNQTSGTLRSILRRLILH
jgi:serine/threonine protein kinase